MKKKCRILVEGKGVLLLFCIEVDISNKYNSIKFMELLKARYLHNKTASLMILES